MKEILAKYHEKDYIVLVDDRDYEFLFRHKWYLFFGPRSESPYAIMSTRDKNDPRRVVFMHHLVAARFGRIDHIDGNTLNNQFDNLRVATYQENGWNSKKQKTVRGKPCTSQYKGVSYRPLRGKDRWCVIISKGKGKGVLNVGYFYSEEEAALAYNKKVVEMRGEFARLNQI